MLRRSALAVLTAGGLVLLAGCASTVNQTDVEEQISSEVTEALGKGPDTVECPGDLEAKVDATMDCTVMVGTEELPLTVTVTKVDGKDVNFDIELTDDK
jgi:DNA-binding IclR family transcriptional regulator